MQKINFIERAAAWPRLPLALIVAGLVVTLAVILAVIAPWKSEHEH